MNEQITNPEFHAMQAKASEIAMFLKEHLNKNEDEVTALYQQIGIDAEPDKQELLAEAMNAENYIAKSEADRGSIDDMYQSLKNAIEGEGGEM